MAQISGVDQSSAFQPRSYSLQTTLYGLYKTVSLYWSFNNVLSILALLCIPCCVFLAAYLHNSEKLKAVLIATASILCETLFSLFVYSYNTQRFFTWIFIWCWLLWVLWPKEKELFVFPIHSLSLFYASLLAFFMFISLPSYNGWRTAAEDIFKDYSGGKACAKFINDNLPSSAIIMQTDTSAFAAIFPWLNEGIEVYSTESGRVESFKEWHDQSSLMNNMDEVKAWVKEKAPDIHEFWIILSEAGTNSAASNSIFQWCSYRFADIEVFSNYYQCISNDEYIVCKIEL